MNTVANQLSPAYDFGVDDTEISLKQGTAHIRINGAWYRGDGEVKMKFLPMPKIYVHGRFENVDIPFKAAVLDSFFRNEDPSFCFNDMTVDGALGNPAPKEADDGAVSLVWRPSIEQIACCGNDTSKMICAVFHVFNFLDFRCPNNEQKITLTGGGWEVELSPLTVTSENIKSLKERGGYKLTHVGRIQKTGGAPFTGKDLEECLQALALVLSFAKGDWCLPICVQGYDETSECVWEKLSSPREERYSDFYWFDEMHAEQLSSFFKGFMNIWTSDGWRDTLEHAIGWYLGANNTYKDAGIILAQAALERFMYHDPELSKLNDNEAYKRLKITFSSKGIPLHVPRELPRLHAYARNADGTYLDAPSALISIRKELAHTKDGRKFQKRLDKAKLSKFEVYFDAWNLYLWYLEMCIFAACKYKGTYRNRLKSRCLGKVEAVPWVKTAPYVTKTCAPSSLLSKAPYTSPSTEPEHNQE